MKTKKLTLKEDELINGSIKLHRYKPKANT